MDNKYLDKASIVNFKNNFSNSFCKSMRTREGANAKWNRLKSTVKRSTFFRWNFNIKDAKKNTTNWKWRTVNCQPIYAELVIYWHTNVQYKCNGNNTLGAHTNFRIPRNGTFLQICQRFRGNLFKKFELMRRRTFFHMFLVCSRVCKWINVVSHFKRTKNQTLHEANYKSEISLKWLQMECMTC